ncbi:hypothetical protein PGIGA_G00105290 [Pangasianodon gigas]|uniref:Uncharacterized protein n=1 Tax=Pangasianodon gigas TaxID=30993 RepID=A0ACC5W8U1_PANGG|nr:hypothetical protein [Pangasianodon gigas]
MALLKHKTHLTGSSTLGCIRKTHRVLSTVFEDSIHGPSVVDHVVPAASHTLPLPVANHPPPAANHALSVSSDSGNSTVSVKTYHTDDAQQSLILSGLVSHPVPDGLISPCEKWELEQLLSGLEGQSLLFHQGFILSFECQDLPADNQPENKLTVIEVDRQEGLPKPALSTKVMSVHQGRGSFSIQECLVDYSGQNRGMYRSQSYGVPVLDGDTRYLPQAPERSTSSKEAVQRGLSAWHQYGLMDDPFFGANTSPPCFPSHSGTSQQEVEQSIEALDILMLALEPHSPMPKSHSAPPRENNSAFQPFCQTIERPSYQADQAIHNYTNRHLPSTSASFGQSSQRSSPACTMTPPADIHQRHYQTPHSPSPTYQKDPYRMQEVSVTTPPPTIPLPSPIKPQTVYPGGGVVFNTPELQSSSPYPVNQWNYTIFSSPLPTITPAKEPEPAAEEESLNLEGLVAHRVAEYNARIRGISKSMSNQLERHHSYSFSGSHSYMSTPDETASSTRCCTSSEGQYNNSHEESSAHGNGSPQHCASPKFVNTIDMNPGGQPKEGHMRSYREAFEEVESVLPNPIPSSGSETHPLTPDFPVSPTTSPQTPYINLCRSPPGLNKTLLSSQDPKSPNPSEVLFQHSISDSDSSDDLEEPQGYMSSVDRGRGVVSPVHCSNLPTVLNRAVPFSQSFTPPQLTSRTISNPDGEPVPAPLFPDPMGYLNPEEATVNVMGVHRVPGSPNTLHRTVATNTPPSPALQRRQCSPGMGCQNMANERSSELSMPNNHLLAHSGKSVLPVSPVLSRHTSAAVTTAQNPTLRHNANDRQGAQSRQSLSSMGPQTPLIPLEQPARKREARVEKASSDSTQNSTSPSPMAASTPSPAPCAPQEPGIVSIYADVPPDITFNVKFFQDTSKFWYKPDISREQAISLLKDREPGAFVIRDSHSFLGAYGLAMKVACPPPTLQKNKKGPGDMANELVRHFLIETTPKGVRLKGSPNEPYFGCLSALVYQHSITPLALPCKLMIPTIDSGLWPDVHPLLPFREEWCCPLGYVLWPAGSRILGAKGEMRGGRREKKGVSRRDRARGTERREREEKSGSLVPGHAVIWSSASQEAIPHNAGRWHWNSWRTPIASPLSGQTAASPPFPGRWQPLLPFSGRRQPHLRLLVDGYGSSPFQADGSDSSPFQADGGLPFY